MDIAAFLAAPLAAALLLAAILGYFGIHVILRRVIFVDLALAQIAALGTLVAFLAGHEPGSTVALGYSLGAALLGAAVLSWTRTRRERVPQEALIGITYVVASALAIVIPDRAPEGAEHIKELLAGAILWVTWPTLARDFIVYCAVGLLHYRLRDRFLLISEAPEEAFARGVRVRLWDFVFYGSFAVVITFAVGVGGILMVFTYLVGPAILAVGSCDGWPARLAVAWAAGTIASVVGLAASYRWDLPSGPAVVCMVGVMLIAYAIVRVPRTRAG
ncbi:MAG: metal ABC transporter permease [Deltaproteobacteria bacterium]|nr:MAG: metal ABC transporter permease [Deltaproteobacteria bacterium]